MRVLLVVNPRATRVTARRRSIVEDRLAVDHDLTVLVTAARDHATELARLAAADGHDHVVVLAGDGTLNEVVGALAGTDCPVACLPGGSTNVFARTLGIPDDIARATDLVSRGILEGRTRRVGLGRVNDRWFLLHTGVGWDAELVSIVERHAPLKRFFGHGLFVYAGLRAFFRTYDRRHPHFEVCLVDGEGQPHRVSDGYFALVLNSDPYTYVGRRPFVVDPDASLDTPFTVAIVRDMRVASFGALPIAALRGGGLRSDERLEVHHRVQSLTISRLPGAPPPAMPHQVDGDHLGEADVLRFEHHPAALTIVDPLGLSPV